MESWWILPLFGMLVISICGVVPLPHGAKGRPAGIHKPCGGKNNSYGFCSDGLECKLNDEDEHGICDCLQTVIPQDCGALFDDNRCFIGCRPYVPFIGGCNPYECPSVNCTGGIVKDEDGCCDVCAQIIGEECGMGFNACDGGLKCKKHANGTHMRCVEDVKRLDEICGGVNGEHGQCGEGMKCHFNKNETKGTCRCSNILVPQDCVRENYENGCFKKCLFISPF